MRENLVHSVFFSEEDVTEKSLDSGMLVHAMSSFVIDTLHAKQSVEPSFNQIAIPFRGT